MSLINNGITSVRAFSLPCGIWPDGGCADMPQVVLVKWKSVLKDVLYQVYVNGQFAGSTICFGQKEMMVHVPPSFTSAARIEVFAVQPENADIDFSSELDNPFNGGRLKIRLSRSQDLPVGATAFICFDNGTGQIDYENSIADIQYTGQKLYRFKTMSLNAGTYTFAIKAIDSSGIEDNSLKKIKIQINNMKPSPMEIFEEGNN